MKKAKHSYRTANGEIRVACSECRYGGKGDIVPRCGWGGKYKKWNGLGCCGGLLLQDLEIK